MYKNYMKRLIDVILCSIGIIILSPVFLITALLIKLESKDNI